MSSKTKINTTISPRGQITLPSYLREKLGLEGGSTVTLEEQNGTIVLRPATVVELEIYSESRLKDFSKADKLAGDLHQEIEKLRSKRSPKKAAHE